MVLPGAAYAEKEGTYTNYRGIIQRLYPAFEPPGEAGHDLNIMLELAEAMKEGLDFKTINEVSRDLSRRIEGYVAIEHIDPMGWAGIM
jgi:formate dehydrogenase major subunit